jgi:hypothetical protein
MLVNNWCWQVILSLLLIADVKGVFVVEAAAAVQFMHDISKSNTAEAGLHLLSAVLGHENASRDAVAATEANALQVIQTLITCLTRCQHHECHVCNHHAVMCAICLFAATAQNKG